MMKADIERRRALAGSAIALSIALSGCSALGGQGDAPRDEEGRVTEEASIDVFALEAGDCMPARTTVGEITDVEVVPCSQPHVEEVFYEFELADDDMPSDEEITAQVETECVPAFSEFVGLDYYESTLELRWMAPTEQTWGQAADRLVQCIVYQPDPADATGQTSLEVTGSLAGAGI